MHLHLLRVLLSGGLEMPRHPPPDLRVLQRNVSLRRMPREAQLYLGIPHIIRRLIGKRLLRIHLLPEPAPGQQFQPLRRDKMHICRAEICLEQNPPLLPRAQYPPIWRALHRNLLLLILKEAQPSKLQRGKQGWLRRPPAEKAIRRQRLLRRSPIPTGIPHRIARLPPADRKRVPQAP